MATISMQGWNKTKMKQEDEIEYKEFEIGDIFRKIDTEKIHGHAHDFPTERSAEYCIPLLTAGTTNYGLSRYARRCDCPTILKNVISIAANGSAGVTYYQHDEFAVLQDAYAVTLIDRDIASPEEGLFLATVLNKAICDTHNWNNKAGWNNIKNDKCSLPVDSSGAPDWAFMSDYVRSLEHDYVRSLDAYMRATGLDDYQLTEHDRQVLKEAEDKEYEEYRIGDLFVSENGDVDLKKEDITGRGYPLITSGVSNNGVAGLTDKPARVIPGNTITMDMFGYAFYRPKSYKMVTHARVFSLEPLFEMNEQIGLYMTAQFAKYPQMFSYSNMCSFNKIQDNTLSLPVTSSGSIDWAFMSDYIRVMEKLVIWDVVDWKDKKLKLTRELVDGSEEDGENKAPQAADGSLA